MLPYNKSAHLVHNMLHQPAWNTTWSGMEGMLLFDIVNGSRQGTRPGVLVKFGQSVDSASICKAIIVSSWYRFVGKFSCGSGTRHSYHTMKIYVCSKSPYPERNLEVGFLLSGSWDYFVNRARGQYGQMGLNP